MLSGWISRLFTNLTTGQTRFFTTFSVPGFMLLIIGAALAIYLTVRVPKQRSLVASVALAYGIYIPVGVAGFGLTSKVAGLFPEALKVAGVHLFSVLLIGALVLILLKLRPFTFFGYLLTAILLGVGVYSLIVTSALGSALQTQVQPFINATQTAKPQSSTLLAFTSSNGDAATRNFCNNHTDHRDHSHQYRSSHTHTHDHHHPQADTGMGKGFLQ